MYFCQVSIFFSFKLLLFCKALNYDETFSTVALDTSDQQRLYLCIAVVCKTYEEEFSNYLGSTGWVKYVGFQLVGYVGIRKSPE